MTQEEKKAHAISCAVQAASALVGPVMRLQDGTRTTDHDYCLELMAYIEQLVPYFESRWEEPKKASAKTKGKSSGEKSDS